MRPRWKYRFSSRIAWGILGLCLVGLAWAANIVPNPMIPFPENYRTAFVQYGIVDRNDGKSRDIFVSPQGLEALRAGLPLPVGTTIAIEAFLVGGVQDNQGHLIREKPANQLHVLTKIQPGEGLRVWGFGAFTLDGKPEPVITEMPGGCLACHQQASDQDLIFSIEQLKQFAATNEVQFLRCNLSGRQICPSQSKQP